MQRSIKYFLFFLLISFSILYVNGTVLFAREKRFCQDNHQIHTAYKVISCQNASQYNGKVTHFRHKDSGATIVYIENDDSEKSFTIGFKTPVHDDTGVNHIIEHCLLGGSTREDSKPFTWLLNHSGATFLNAMTFHDFTVYALASRDESEFLKLMTTYMDSIFFPAVMSDESIFRREGWRATGDGYNGTVYNEMKGVYSTDSAFLQRAIYASLFPDSTYQFDSGGVPDFIPSLSFEQFSSVYNSYYRPDNALIVLYGKQDIESVLSLLDENYLSQEFSYPTELRFDTDSYLQAAAIKHPTMQYASYPASEGKSTMAVNYVVCDREDAVNAARMELLAALMDDGNAAAFNDVVKQGLAERVSIKYNSMMTHCVLSIVYKDIDPSKATEIKAITDDCIKRMARTNVNKKRLESILHQYEYELANTKNRPHLGIDASIDAMSEFVYGSAMDDEVYKKAIDSFDRGFVKASLKKRLLNNPHSTVVVLSPKNIEDEVVSTAGNYMLQAKASGSFSKKEKKTSGSSLQAKTKTSGSSLQAEAKTDGSMKKTDTKKLSAKVPVEVPTYHTSEQGSVKLVNTHLDTHGISSIHLFLDISSLPQDLIKYAQIFAHAVTDTSTLPPNATIGEIRGHVSADKIMGKEDFTPRLHLVLKGLDSDIPSMTKICASLLNPKTTLDKQVVYNYLVRAKHAMDDNYENQMPIIGCLAKLSKAGLYEYDINGPPYYRFVSEILSDFDSKWPEVSKNITNVKKMLTDDTGAVVSFSGSEAASRQFKKYSKLLTGLFPTDSKSSESKFLSEYDIPLPTINVFPTPLSQTYAVVQGGVMDSSYNGAFLVTAKLLNYDYLWPKIRDVGGAYGVTVSVLHDRAVLVRSYRDPNKEQTLNVYKGIPEFLRQPVDESDFAGVRAHVLAEWDEQFQPHRLWDYGAKVELGIIDLDILNRIRLEILYSQPGDLIYDADIWEDILEQGVYAVGGRV